MNISVKAEIKEATKHLSRVERKQIPYAASQALNDVAKQAAMKTLRDKAQATFKGGANAWTKKGFRYKKSNKRNLEAVVFIAPQQAEYMQFQIAGGTRFPNNRFVRVPTRHTKLARNGNLNWKTASKLYDDKSKYFFGTPKGSNAGDGVWERYGRKTKKGGGQRIRMVASFQSSSQYRPLFPFAETTAGVVFSRNGGFAARFRERLAKAIATAK